MLSDNKYTIEDIHRIRYENYEKTKNMTAEELIEATRKDAEKGWIFLAELKAKKTLRS